MADKLKTSKIAAEQLNILSSRLSLKRNVICRIAIATSLSKKCAVPEIIVGDLDGYEFNKSTILGPDELIFRSVAAYVQNKPMDSDFFNIIIRNHLERGLDIIYNEYEKVNSPVTFLTLLAKNKSGLEL